MEVLPTKGISFSAPQKCRHFTDARIAMAFSNGKCVGVRLAVALPLKSKDNSQNMSHTTQAVLNTTVVLKPVSDIYGCKSAVLLLLSLPRRTIISNG
jgi:hypothetical protein